MAIRHSALRLLILLATVAPPAWGFEPAGPEVYLNDSVVHPARAFDSATPAVVHDAANRRLLVTWTGRGLVRGVWWEPEVYLRRVDAVTGEPLDRAPLQVSALGPEADPAFFAFPGPAISFSPERDEAMVVWTGLAPDAAGEPTPGLFGRRISGATGEPIGAARLLSGRVAPDSRPALAHDPLRDRHVVVWDAPVGAAPGEAGLFALALDAATGEPVGEPVRISAPTFAGDLARRPRVLYLAEADELLIAWSERGGGPELLVVIAARLDAETLRPLDAGSIAPPGQAAHPLPEEQRSVALAQGPAGEVVVVWVARPSLEEPRSEVWARTIAPSSLDPLGPPVQASDTDAETVGFGPEDPEVSYDPATGGFVAFWSGEAAPAPDAEFGLRHLEVFGRRLDPDGRLAGPATQVSCCAGDSPVLRRAAEPAAVALPAARQVYLAYAGDEEDVKRQTYRHVVGLRLLGPGEPMPPLRAPFWLSGPHLPGFRVQVLIVDHLGRGRSATVNPECLAETLCVAGALPGRTELLVRVPGPKPNGFLWPTLTKLSTSRFEVWIQQLATGRIRHYVLEGAEPGTDELPGMFDRHGFEPG